MQLNAEYTNKFMFAETLDLVCFRKPCSGYKLKEITGNNIFAADAESDTAELDGTDPTNKTGLRMYQVLFGQLL